MLLENFPDTIRVLSDVCKKTPVEPRLEQLKKMKEITYEQLRLIEPQFVKDILPLI